MESTEREHSSRTSPRNPSQVLLFHMTAIGIDLGTTNSCVAVFKNNKIEIAENSSGQRTTPSYVLFTDDGPVIGNEAKKQISRYPENTVFNMKRFIGLGIRNPTVTSDIKNLPFKVVGDNGIPMICVTLKGKIKLFSPVEISGLILGELKKTAEAWLSHEPVTEAVISVPARFNYSQRRATLKAAELVGLKVLQLINEPTAAAVAFGLTRKISKVNKVLIYDLGGGTFDVTLVAIKDGDIKVLATGGDKHLGGEDFNNRIVDHYIAELKHKHAKDIAKNTRAVSRLRAQCEEAKCSLSFKTDSIVCIDCLYEGIDFDETLTRDRFEELNNDLFEKTLTHLGRVLKDAKIERKDVDRIVVVGGSTRIPKVRKLLADYFGVEELETSINPDTAIARGAAVQAAMLKGYNIDGVHRFLLEDVVPLSLGYVVMGDLMSVLVPRNTPIPTKQTIVTTTSGDNQTKLDYSIYEGERKRASANTLLGEFELSGIPAAPMSVPKIDVTFEIDRNGILKVSAVCRGVGEPKEMTVTEYRSLRNSDSIEARSIVTKECEAEDEEHVRRGAAMTALDNYAYEMKSKMDETIVKSEISESDRGKVTEKCNEVIEWVLRFHENISVAREDFERRREELKSMCTPIIEKLKLIGGVGICDDIITDNVP